MITIVKYSEKKEGVLGAWKYLHLIQYSENGYKYQCNMTDEGMMFLLSALEKAGNKVTFVCK